MDKKKRLNADDVRHFFIDCFNDVYVLSSYFEEPTVTFTRVRDLKDVHFAVESIMAQDFIRLIPENERE